MDPIQNMKVNETNMTKSELKIMHHAIHHLDTVTSHSLISFAETIGVSKSALLRFCQKIGYGGYSEFKYDVSHYLAKKNQTRSEDADIDSVATIYAQTILELDTTLQESSLLHFKSLITQAHKIKVFGVAETGLSAGFFSHRLLHYGYDAETITQLNFFPHKVMLSQPEDLHIVFSLSSNTEAIRDSVKLSAKRKIPTVLITQNDRTDLKDKVDCFILLPFFKYDALQEKILDSQVIIHAFIGIFLNLLVENQE